MHKCHIRICVLRLHLEAIQGQGALGDHIGPFFLTSVDHSLLSRHLFEPPSKTFLLFDLAVLTYSLCTFCSNPHCAILEVEQIQVLYLQPEAFQNQAKQD